MKPWIFGVITTLIAFGAVSAKAELQGTVTRTAGKLTLEVAEAVALRQVTTEAGVIAKLGSEGASLWAALKNLELKGNLSTDATHWENLRKQVEAQDLTSDDVSGWISHCANKGLPLTQKTMETFLGRTSGSPEVGSVAVTETPEETFLKYYPRADRTTKYKNELTASQNRLAARRMNVAGRALQSANRMPETCSAGAKAYCATNAPEFAMMWAQEATETMKSESDQPQFSEEFVQDFFAAFPKESPRLAGEAYIPGGLAIMKMKPRPAHLQNCLVRGRPDLN